MTTLVDYLLPGEQLAPERPWLRLVGDEVIRFVRPEVESRRIDIAREMYRRSGDHGPLEDTLKKEAHDLQVHLSLLRELGVSVVSTTAEVTEVPARYTEDGRGLGAMPGIMLCSEFVPGQDLCDYLGSDEKLHQKEEVMAPVIDGLIDYVQVTCEDHPTFLGDIFLSRQFKVGRTLATGNPIAKLVDVDPFFAEASMINAGKAMSTVGSISSL